MYCEMTLPMCSHFSHLFLTASVLGWNRYQLGNNNRPVTFYNQDLEDLAEKLKEYDGDKSYGNISEN